MKNEEPQPYKTILKDPPEGYERTSESAAMMLDEALKQLEAAQARSEALRKAEFLLD